MSPVDRFVASVASRTPAQNAAILGVSEAALLDAARPGSETFADFLDTCPRVSISATVEAEAVKLGRPPTDHEAQAAVSRAVLAAIKGADDATLLHDRCHIEIGVGRAARSIKGGR